MAEVNSLLTDHKASTASLRVADLAKAASAASEDKMALSAVAVSVLEWRWE